MPVSLKDMVAAQVGRVLARGQRLERFDQLRSRHFWSSYLFAPGAGNDILQAPYDIFKVIPSQTGQGYPTNVPLTLRETNWLNAGRVPDNQNFVITEIGASVIRPPAVAGTGASPTNAPTNGIFANLSGATQALINPSAPLHPQDVANVLYGMNLEMSFLTNNVPLGYLADFSQSSGIVGRTSSTIVSAATVDDDTGVGGDPTTGIPCAAFRRKLEIPILLQHGETMGMRLNVHRNIPTLALNSGGCGWCEVRIDWWANESFVEKS